MTQLIIAITKSTIDLLLAVAHWNQTRGRDLATAALYFILGAIGVIEVLPL